MNVIKTVRVTGDEREYFEIEVDGKPLAQYFERQYRDLISPLGWSPATKAYQDPGRNLAAMKHQEHVVAQFLVEKPSKLESGRIPLLVCPYDGGIDCGCIAARVLCMKNVYTWDDWAYENDYEPAFALSWPWQPGNFVFDRATYESEIRQAP